jgi:pimeloyl-ACP methyl ester carboxylesterase
MISANETFNGSFPFTPNFSIAPGFKMHYVDEGKGPVVVCLHGEPTWGYLFRHLIHQLSGTHRVIVPDHMGFGKSETPADRTYWLQDHINNLEKLLLDLNLHNITLIINDFGGPVGMGFAARHPGRVARIISVNGPTPFGQPDLGQLFDANVKVSPWFQWILQAEKNGNLESVLNELHYNILSTLKLNGFEQNNLITNDWLEAYRSPFTSAKECLGAIGWAKGLAGGKHQFEEPTEQVKVQIGKLPAMAIWGKADRTLQSRYFLPLFQSVFPKGLIYELEKAGHYSLEDAPEVIGLLIRQFLELTAQ